MKKEKINEAKRIIADKWVNTPSWIKEVIYAVLDKYGKYIYDYSWMSGSSTEVYPIMVWRDYVDFQYNRQTPLYPKVTFKDCRAFSAIERCTLFQKRRFVSRQPHFHIQRAVELTRNTFGK